VRSEASQQRDAGIAEIWEGRRLADRRAAAGSAWLSARLRLGRQLLPNVDVVAVRSAKTKPRTIVGRPLTIRTPTVTMDNFARVLTITSGVCPCEDGSETTARLCKMNLAIHARRRGYPVRRLLRRPVLAPCSLASAHTLLFPFPRPWLSGPWNACVPACEAYPGELNSAGFAWCRQVPKSLDKTTSITK
jgi:hypothetical protein